MAVKSLIVEAPGYNPNMICQFFKTSFAYIRLARDKHSSLLRKSISYGCKKSYFTGLRIRSNMFCRQYFKLIFSLHQACQGQTPQIITEIHKLQLLKVFYSTGPKMRSKYALSSIKKKRFFPTLGLPRTNTLTYYKNL